MSGTREQRQLRAVFRRLKAAIDTGFDGTPEGLVAALRMTPRRPSQRIPRRQPQYWMWDSVRLGRMELRWRATMNTTSADLHIMLFGSIIATHEQSLAALNDVFGKAEMQVSSSKKGWWHTYAPGVNPTHEMHLIFDFATKRRAAEFNCAMISPKR